MAILQQYIQDLAPKDTYIQRWHQVQQADIPNESVKKGCITLWSVEGQIHGFQISPSCAVRPPPDPVLLFLVVVVVSVRVGPHPRGRARCGGGGGGAHFHLRLLLLRLAAPPGDVLQDGLAHLLRVGKFQAFLGEGVGILDVT